MTFVLAKEIAELSARASASNQDGDGARRRSRISGRPEHEQRPAVQVVLSAVRGRVFLR